MTALVVLAYVVIAGGFVLSLCMAAGDADRRALSHYEQWRAEQ